MHVPLFNTERILNEGACLKFLTEKTNIPLPKLYVCFKDDGAACLVTEYVERTAMNDLDEEKKTVAKELELHLETLKKLTSDTWGGPGGMAILSPGFNQDSVLSLSEPEPDR